MIILLNETQCHSNECVIAIDNPVAVSMPASVDKVCPLNGTWNTSGRDDINAKRGKDLTELVNRHFTTPVLDLVEQLGDPGLLVCTDVHKMHTL